MDYPENTMNPIDQIAALLDQVKSLGRLAPVCLSTSASSGAPNARFVDLKEVSEGQLYFGTDERSVKAQEFLANPEVSLCGWWETIPVQIRVLGRVTRAPTYLSDRVFLGRNPTAQALAWVSVQSAPLTDSDAVRAKIERFLADSGGPIARPDTWWVYGLAPREIEILRFSVDRIHERSVYHLEGGAWSQGLLSP